MEREEIDRFVDAVLEGIDWNELYRDIYRRLWEIALEMDESQTFPPEFTQSNE